MIKKIIFAILIILIFSIIPLFSQGYDISAGGGYRFGLHYMLDYLTGFHQQAIAAFTYCYNINDFFSVGVRNKIGYGFSFFDSKKELNQANANIVINFNTLPMEHEIYENASFMLKIGKTIKFAFGLGCAFKYSFLNIPDGSFSISFNPYDPDFNFIILEPGDYSYLSIGPSFDFNLEVLNKSKTFSFMIGSPFEFLIPINGQIKRIQLQSDVVEDLYDAYLVLVPNYIDTFYLNFSVGFEFIFCFNYHGDL